MRAPLWLLFIAATVRACQLQAFATPSAILLCALYEPGVTNDTFTLIAPYGTVNASAVILGYPASNESLPGTNGYGCNCEVGGAQDPWTRFCVQPPPPTPVILATATVESVNLLLAGTYTADAIFFTCDCAFELLPQEGTPLLGTCNDPTANTTFTNNNSIVANYSLSQVATQRWRDFRNVGMIHYWSGVGTAISPSDHTSFNLITWPYNFNSSISGSYRANAISYSNATVNNTLASFLNATARIIALGLPYGLADIDTLQLRFLCTATGTPGAEHPYILLTNMSLDGVPLGPTSINISCAAAAVYWLTGLTRTNASRVFQANLLLGTSSWSGGGDANYVELQWGVNTFLPPSNTKPVAIFFIYTIHLSVINTK